MPPILYDYDLINIHKTSEWLSWLIVPTNMASHKGFFNGLTVMVFWALLRLVESPCQAHPFLYF